MKMAIVQKLTPDQIQEKQIEIAGEIEAVAAKLRSGEIKLRFFQNDNGILHLDYQI